MINKKIYFADNEKEYFETFILKDYVDLQHGKKRPAAIVCPGGAYMFLSDREAEPIVFQFLAKGYHTFLLNYCVGNGEGEGTNVLPKALKQLAMTIKTIRENADEWNVDPDKIVIIGFSAGAHLCACMSGQWHRKWLKDSLNVQGEELKPNATILMYPVIDYEAEDQVIEHYGYSWKEMPDIMTLMSRALSGYDDLGKVRKEYLEYDNTDLYNPVTYVSELNPPTFLGHAADDYFIYAENSLVFTKKLAENRVPFELHIFEKGGHGFSLANDFTSSEEGQKNSGCAKWVELATEWLKYHIEY